MRITRTLAAVAALALLAACGAESASPVLPAGHSLRDGAGWSGSGNVTTTSTTDTTVAERGAGWSGSGN